MKILFTAILLLFSVSGCNSKNSATKPLEKGRGIIIEGLRTYSVEEVIAGNLTAFRGDYMVIQAKDTATFAIDSLKISHSFPPQINASKYIKLKNTGIFDYTFKNITGKITIVEYAQPNYKAVNANEAHNIISNISPLILDVRTPNEYANGHLNHSILIPVSQIQTRYKELMEYRDKPILIYCASGNRSTVASRILIDNGFMNIYNLESGISGWYRAGLEIIK